MSLVWWGALLGAAAGAGLMLALHRLVDLRRPRLEVRVLPYLRDLPAVSGRATGPRGATGELPARVLVGALLQEVAARLDRLLGGSGSVRRRLERANLPLTVHDFRVEQVVWGLVCFAAAAGVSFLLAATGSVRALPLVGACLAAGAAGALLRENRLTAQAKERERRMLAEFPTVAELLSLAVAAGEGPVAALDRVVTRTHGELSVELAAVLAQVRTGSSVSAALDQLARRSGLPVVSRFAEALAVALERGTPLADVLHAQAADVREAGRRALIESGARREVLMMVPVVFLVLPVTVLFAFWPGLVGLRLVSP
jgi:tight adherence protein C